MGCGRWARPLGFWPKACAAGADLEAARWESRRWAALTAKAGTSLVECPPKVQRRLPPVQADGRRPASMLSTPALHSFCQAGVSNKVIHHHDALWLGRACPGACPGACGGTGCGRVGDAAKAAPAVREGRQEGRKECPSTPHGARHIRAVLSSSVVVVTPPPPPPAARAPSLAPALRRRTGRPFA